MVVLLQSLITDIAANKHVLDEINGMAEVVTDNLQNTYQRVPD